MIKSLTLALSLSAAFLVLGTASSAPLNPPTIPITARTEAAGKKQVGAILIGGTAAVRLKTSYADIEPAERAKIAAAKLRLKISEGLRASDIRAEKQDGLWTVSAGDEPFLFVNRREARAQDSDPDTLARLWAKQIRNLLSVPALKLESASIIVPATEKRSLRVSGWAARNLQVTTSGGSNSIKAEIKGNRLILVGIAPGIARVKLTAGSHSAECAVIVRKYAGDLKVVIRAEVTGNPAPASLLAEASELAVKRHLPKGAGAWVKVIHLQRPGRSLAQGKKALLTAKVRIAGPNYLPVEGTVRIEVANVRVPVRRASQLMYSNFPEQISTDQTLYFAEIPSKVSGRLFYHHINSARTQAVLSVMIVNPEDKPIRVQIIPGFVYPHPDPVRAGHRAGRAFFSRYLKNVGEIYTLPPRSAAPLVFDLLKPQDVGSGMAEIRTLEPESARCYIRITASYQPVDATLKAIAAHRDAWRRVMPRPALPVEMAESADSPDLYATTAKQITAEYTVGNKWTWIPVGKEPVTDSAGTRRLEGNYGVIYNIDVTVHNPGEKRRQVEVAFEAGAGQASGVFSIADQYVEVANIFPREEKHLARFTMGPNETRSISIQTVPLGGSAYPATLIFR